MVWWGKAAGAVFGFLLWGVWGALLGALVGHLFDRGLVVVRLVGPQRSAVQASFFATTFQLLGHLAKADGRVNEDEIAFARSVMARMSLNEEQRRQAIAHFQEGKRPDFPVDAVLQRFRADCRGQPLLLRAFLEILLQAANADGAVTSAERALLQRVAEQLGVRAQWESFEGRARAEWNFGRGGSGGDARLREAYALLGVPATASDAEVKRAYRRLVSQHHPDKLVAKGLPEEMMRLAKEKTQALHAAYDLIRSSRRAAATT